MIKIFFFASITLSSFSMDFSGLTKVSKLDENQVLDIKKFLVRNKASDLVSNSGEIGVMEKCFYPLYFTLKSYQGLADIRLFTVDCLGVWLLRSSQIMALENVDPYLTTRLRGLISDDIASFLFDYVVDFWNESGSPLSNALRDLLGKLVTFLGRFEPRELFHSWVHKVLVTIPYSKRVFYFVIQTLTKHIDCRVILKQSPKFIEDSLAQMFSHAFANSVAKCVNAVLIQLYEVCENEFQWREIWMEPIVKSLTTFDLCKNIQIYLLPLVFQIPEQPRPTYKSFLAALLDTSDSEDEFKLSLYLGCLRIGVDLQIDESPFDGEDPLIGIETLRRYLYHEHKTIRVTAFSILVSSTKKARAVQPYVYRMVTDVLNVYFVDDDPDARNDFFSLTRNFIFRVRDSTHVANKNLSGLLLRGLDVNNDKLKLQIEEGKAFIVEVVEKIKKQITPGATYQRLHLAFSLLSALVMAGVDSRVDSKYLERKQSKFAFSIDLYSPEIVRLLIDNIVNNFDDIRQFSVRLLEMAPSPLQGLSSKESVSLLFEKSITILKNIQGKQSDSGARLLQFVFTYNKNQKRFEENERIIEYLFDCLDSGLKIAEDDMKSAVSNHPVHGFYKGLSVVLENYDFDESSNTKLWRSRVVRLLSLVHQTWILTKNILSNDSPEGNVPGEFSSVPGDIGIDIDVDGVSSVFSPFAQIISNYAWRAVKDSSAVLKHLLVMAPKTILPKESVLDIGNLILDQLSSVNHKGAFYSIYPTFEECCHRCYRPRSELMDVPEKWLADNLGLIQSKSTYIIRRSAGLPFLISIILVAEVRKSGKKAGLRSKNTAVFQRTFNQLFEAAISPINEEEYNLSDNIELPQVHAYNCLKQLFIEANLSDVSALYVDRGLELSFKGIQSGIWAIRNCAVMLFAALENKLFGSQKVGEVIKPFSARLFFSRFKQMRRILLENFADFLKNQRSHSSSSNSSLESIFPILTILSRLEPTTDFHNVLSDFEPFMVQSLGLKYCKIREMSAKALPSLFYQNELYDQCEKLILRAKNENLSTNMMHGVMLATREILTKKEKLSSIVDPVPSSIAKSLFSLAGKILVQVNVPLISKVYVDSVHKILRTNGSFEGVAGAEITQNVNILGNYFLSVESNYGKKPFDGSQQLVCETIVGFLLSYYLASSKLIELDQLVELSLDSSLYRVKLVGYEFFNENASTLIAKLPKTFLEKIEKNVWSLLNSKNEWTYIKASALRVLSTIISLKPSSSDSHNKLNTLLTYLGPGNSEDVKASALQASGAFVGDMYISKSLTKEVYTNWVKQIERNSHDDNIMDLRLASCKSLVSMLSKISDANHSKSFASKTRFLLYFRLSDNSEEIRIMAASYFCELYGFKSLLPIEVERIFIERFPFEADANDVLFEYFTSCTSFREKVTPFLDLDKVLFDAEKSNLYRIEWVHHQSVVKAALSVKFSEDQCKILKQKFTNDWNFLMLVITDKKHDGVLGWTSHSELFNGVKIVLADMKLYMTLNNDVSLQKYHDLCEEFEVCHSLRKI